VCDVISLHHTLRANKLDGAEPGIGAEIAVTFEADAPYEFLSGKWVVATAVAHDGLNGAGRARNEGRGAGLGVARAEEGGEIGVIDAKGYPGFHFLRAGKEISRYFLFFCLVGSIMSPAQFESYIYSTHHPRWVILFFFTINVCIRFLMYLIVIILILKKYLGLNTFFVLIFVVFVADVSHFHIMFKMVLILTECL